MGEYTSPIFGSQNFTPWSPKALDVFQYFKKPNRKESVKINDKGQIYASDVYVNWTYHTHARLNNLTTLARNAIGQVRLESTADRPLAILAVPVSYGNLPETGEGYNNAQYWWEVLKYHENPAFVYILVARTSGASINAYWDYTQENGSKITSVLSTYNLVQNREWEYGIEPELVNKPGERVQVYTQTRDLVLTPDYGLDNRLQAYIKNIDVQKKVHAGTQDFGFITEGAWAAIQTGISHWKDRSGNHFDQIRALDISNVVHLADIASTTNLIGSFIATGLPVFNSSTSFDEMVKYFENEPWESDNDPIPEDFSTKWDIYIKGAQKPDIYITMKSDEIDRWLASDSNKAGAVKEDIKVEYRYPEFEYKIPPDPSEPPIPSDEYTLKNWEKDTYNDTRETTYESNVMLNFPGITNVIGMNEFSSFAIEGLYPFYANMQFRLKLDEEHHSAWCRYKIGVIGSPSVPDFTFMQNEGLQDDQRMIDGSTVTLHYDEVPPGFDPFPIPPIPPLPPVSDTEPTPLPPGLNGLGLLTTTYKVTQSTTEALGRFFWGGDLFEKIKALNTSPIENVVGLMIMPVNIAGSTSNIVIGNVDTNLNGDVITTIPLYTVGTLEWKGRYNSFLDFEPYTTAYIYLPFVGFIRIDPAYFTNKQLKVIYSFDIVCGLCNAMLFSDGIFVESHQGHCGINIPLIATNRADLQIGLASALLETGASIATMGVVGTKNVVSAGVSTVEAVADYATGFHSSRQSGYSPTCIWHETRTCFVVIESVNATHSATYNRDKGRPTIASAYVGSLSGYTELDAGVNLSGLSGASDAEIEELRQILATGFYV